MKIFHTVLNAVVLPLAITALTYSQLNDLCDDKFGRQNGQENYGVQLKPLICFARGFFTGNVTTLWLIFQPKFFWKTHIKQDNFFSQFFRPIAAQQTTPSTTTTTGTPRPNVTTTTGPPVTTTVVTTPAQTTVVSPVPTIVSPVTTVVTSSVPTSTTVFTTTVQPTTPGAVTTNTTPSLTDSTTDTTTVTP